MDTGQTTKPPESEARKEQAKEKRKADAYQLSQKYPVTHSNYLRLL